MWFEGSMLVYPSVLLNQLFSGFQLECRALYPYTEKPTFPLEKKDGESSLLIKSCCIYLYVTTLKLTPVAFSLLDRDTTSLPRWILAEPVEEQKMELLNAKLIVL